MNSLISFRILACLTAFFFFVRVNAAVYQTINLNAALTDQLKDNTGADLDGTFVASMGTFDTGFSPSDVNVEDWAINWKVFDQTTIQLVPPAPAPTQVPNFQLAADIQDTGFTNSTAPEADTNFDFSGQEIWLWVKNGEDIFDDGTEWFLARVDSWVFPTASSEPCCPGLDPLDLAISDFSAETPVWGSQGGIKGSGIFEFDDTTGEFELQTYKIIPEPGTLLMSALAFSLYGVVLGYRKRRNA